MTRDNNGVRGRRILPESKAAITGLVCHVGLCVFLALVQPWSKLDLVQSSVGPLSSSRQADLLVQPMRQLDGRLYQKPDLV